MELIPEGEFYGTEIRDYVAVPKPEAEKYALAYDGMVIAVAHLHPSGRYTNCPPDEITDDTILYIGWKECIAEQVAEDFGPEEMTELDRITGEQ